MKRRIPLQLLILPLLLAAATWGCSEKCDSCPDCATFEDVTQEEVEEDITVDDTEDDTEEEDGEGDADEEELACVIPEVLCEAGAHGEYGLCVPDSELIHVPAGSFTMGTDGGEDNPAHSVSLAGFFIDQFEITNARYLACVEAGCCTPPQYDGSYTGRQPYYGNPDFDNYPVIFITWHQAQEYCENLGKSLPTEAQWEMAARGDDGRRYPWGDDSATSARVNYNTPINGDTQEVGTHSPGASAFGAEDMAGNVWEWVSDWYDPDYYGSSPADDPAGPDNGIARVARGGGFASHGTEISTYFRGSYHPMEAFSTLGFRCAQPE